MRIAILGMGGVGGYIGAKLCSLHDQNPKKYDIVFIARGAHADAIKTNGLRIIEDESTFIAKPSQVCTAEELEGTFDLILSCVKSYDTEAAIRSLQSHIRPDSVIIPFANGVDNAKKIETLVDAKVINGAVYILSHIEEPGVIRKQGKVFAIIFGSSRYIGESLFVERLFTEVDLRNKRADDIETAVWKKYLFISAFAALTSYFNMNIKAVYETHYSMAKAVLEEIAAVAAAKGIELEGEVEKALESASKLPPSASTSMHLDFQNRHQNELESLCEYVVKAGEQLGVSVKNMKKIYTDLLSQASRF